MAEALTTARALVEFRKELLERGVPEELADSLTQALLPILAGELVLAVRDA